MCVYVFMQSKDYHMLFGAQDFYLTAPVRHFVISCGFPIMTFFYLVPKTFSFFDGVLK